MLSVKHTLGHGAPEVSVGRWADSSGGYLQGSLLQREKIKLQGGRAVACTETRLDRCVCDAGNRQLGHSTRALPTEGVVRAGAGQSIVLTPMKLPVNSWLNPQLSILGG